MVASWSLATFETGELDCFLLTALSLSLSFLSAAAESDLGQWSPLWCDEELAPPLPYSLYRHTRTHINTHARTHTNTHVYLLLASSIFSYSFFFFSLSLSLCSDPVENPNLHSHPPRSLSPSSFSFTFLQEHSMLQEWVVCFVRVSLFNKSQCMDGQNEKRFGNSGHTVYNIIFFTSMK